METPLFLTPSQLRSYGQALDFLERAYQEHQSPNVAPQSAQEVLLLSLAKVVNDCRAILLLAQAGLYIQAGIVARSTLDACSLLMYLGFEQADTALVRRWLAGERITHWVIVDELNRRLEPEYRLNFDEYREVRRRLDDLVHGTYRALRLYPGQWPGRRSASDEDSHERTFWRSLIHLYLVTSLLVVQLAMPEFAQEAALHVEQLVRPVDLG